jgi:hypothetical protein
MIEEATKAIAETRESSSFPMLIQFTVDGYGADQRELWHIPEVVSYFRRLHEECPVLPCWLGKECILLYFQILSGGLIRGLAREAIRDGQLFCKNHLYGLDDDDLEEDSDVGGSYALMAKSLAFQAERRMNDALHL